MKKILYFADFPSIVGGSNKVLLTQAYIMQQRGCEVFVVIPNDANNFHAPEYDQICKSYGLNAGTAHFPIATCMEGIDILEVMETYDGIKKMISDYKPDLIHSTQLNIAVELVARELKIPHLMNIYQTDRQEFLINWLNVYPKYHSADSELFSRRWGEGLGIASRCVRVAYEMKNKVLEKGTDKTGGVNIITIGILCERKNQLEIIRFILKCRIHKKKVRLVLLGENNSLYGEQCKKFVLENGLQDVVIFAGFVLNIEDYLEKADVFILASKVESYPGVLVESMANRVPIISTPVAGVPELLRNGENSFLTNGFAAEDIYQAFMQYEEYEIQGRVSQITDRAYDTYLSYHTYSQVGSRLEDYYEWIVRDYGEEERTYLQMEDVAQIFNQYKHDKKADDIWFFYHVLMLIEKKENKKVAIWGAGICGKKLMKKLTVFGNFQLELAGFIDTNKKGCYLGYPIFQDKDYALEICGTVFVAVLDECARLEIMDYLDQHRKERNRDYFMFVNEPVRI